MFRACSHTLALHVSHLESVPEDELDRLLGIVVDVENLFMCVHKVRDGHPLLGSQNYNL